MHNGNVDQSFYNIHDKLYHVTTMRLQITPDTIQHLQIPLPQNHLNSAQLELFSSAVLI